MDPSQCEKLSLAYRDLALFPDDVVANPSSLTSVDLSNNCITDLSFTGQFPNLRSVNLDSNDLSDASIFTPCPTLSLLSLNNNKFTRLNDLLTKLAAAYPNLKFLSLLKNPVCPSVLTLGSKVSKSAIENYRNHVIACFPELLSLDGEAVDDDAHAEAAQVFAR